MFVHVRFQTGELKEVVEAIKNGNIPCLDVDDHDEYNWVIKELEKRSLYKIDEFSHNTVAKNKLAEPEFEFRDAFSDLKATDPSFDQTKLIYIDFYYPIVEDETYDPVGEM